VLVLLVASAKRNAASLLDRLYSFLMLGNHVRIGQPILVEYVVLVRPVLVLIAHYIKPVVNPEKLKPSYDIVDVLLYPPRLLRRVPYEKSCVVLFQSVCLPGRLPYQSRCPPPCAHSLGWFPSAAVGSASWMEGFHFLLLLSCPDPCGCGVFKLCADLVSLVLVCGYRYCSYCYRIIQDLGCLACAPCKRTKIDRVLQDEMVQTRTLLAV
jgi:hypothetical protein